MFRPFKRSSSGLQFFLLTNWYTSELSLKILKFTLKQLRHVSALQSHHHQGAHYSSLLVTFIKTANYTRPHVSTFQAVFFRPSIFLLTNWCTNELSLKKHIKIYIKIYVKTAPTCFGVTVTPSSGSVVICAYWSYSY